MIIQFYNIFSSPSSNLNSTIQNSQHSGAIYTIRPLNALTSAATSLKKRKIEVLNIETYDNDGKYYIIYLSYLFLNYFDIYICFYQTGKYPKTGYKSEYKT